MLYSIAEIEQATGLNREVLRKWEQRYGFPRPTRSESGERQYSDEQVVRLRLIRRLMDAGFRPSKLAGLEQLKLETLAEGLILPDSGRDKILEDEVFVLLRQHDVDGLVTFFQRHINQQGSLAFVRNKIARLNAAVGEAWFRGELQIFEEHLYTEVVQEVLSRAMGFMMSEANAPRVLLTTPSGELHTLGLTMAKLYFRHAGAYCVNLGPQMPVTEICDAAERLDIDIVGLSVSRALPIRSVTSFLSELGQRLRSQTGIWVGGEGATRLSRRMPRVVQMHSFEEVQRGLDVIRSIPNRKN